MRTSSRWLLIALLLSLPATAVGLGLHPDGTDEGVSVASVDYAFEVRGQFAEATLTAVFESSGGEGAANFRFPLPPRAVIDRAEVYLPEQERWERAAVVGRRQGANGAAELPEQKRLLVQRIGLRLYRARLWGIDAGAPAKLRVRYLQPLESAGDGYRLRVALDDPDAPKLKRIGKLEVSVETRPDAWRRGEWRVAAEEAETAFRAGEGTGRVRFREPIRLGAIRAPGPEEREGADTSSDDGPGIALRLHPAEERDGAAVRYDASSSGAEPQTALRWDPDLPPLEPVDDRGRNIVFVVDRSGSMTGSKLEETKEAIGRALGRLEEGARFGIVAFSTTPTVFRARLSGLEAVDEAVAWLDELEAGGSTNVEKALEKASALAATAPAGDRKLDVLMMSDGLPTSGPRAASTIVSRVRSADGLGDRNVRLFVCGIGTGLDQSFINRVSHRTGGTATFALADSKVTGQLFELLRKARDGGLTDATVTVEGAEGAVREVFEYERVMPEREFLLGIAGEAAAPVSVTLEGTRPDGGLLTRSVELPVAEGSRPFAAPLVGFSFARRAARRIDREGESRERVDRAVLLARRYGIVSRYSSMLGLATPEAYREIGIDRPERDGAGIAVGPVASSTEDERRIGGAGIASAGYTEGCAVAGGRRLPGGLLVFVVAALALLVTRNS